MASSLSKNNGTVSKNSLIRGENLNIVNNLTSKKLLSFSGDPIRYDENNFNVSDIKNGAKKLMQSNIQSRRNLRYFPTKIIAR